MPSRQSSQGMAEQAYSVNWNAEMPQLGMRRLWRLAIWGGLATVCALCRGHIRAIRTRDRGDRRPCPRQAKSAAKLERSGPQPPDAAHGAELRARRHRARPRRKPGAWRRPCARSPPIAIRLLARIAALERNLDDVTGSIKRDRIAGPQPTRTASHAGQAAPAAPVAASRRYAGTRRRCRSRRPQPGPKPHHSAPPPWPHSSRLHDRRRCRPTAAPDAGNAGQPSAVRSGRA